MGNMKEKLESLNLATLKDLAKHRGMKNTSTMKKAALIEALLLAEAGGVTDNTLAEQEQPQQESASVPTVSKEVDVRATDAAQAEAAKMAEVAKTQGRAPYQHSAGNRTTFFAGRVQDQSEQKSYGSKRELAGHHTDDFNEQPVPADGMEADGILEVMQDGFGFIRCENFLPGENDVYVAPGVIRRFGLKTGDMLNGVTRGKSQNEKFGALIHLNTINGYTPEEAVKRANFDQMTPIFPNERLTLECHGCGVAMRIMDLIDPIGKGQRGMIVSPPKAGKTTLLKEVAKSIKRNYPDIHLIVLLIDERPEEVTDIKEDIEGPNAEVIYSTFDELPEHHKRVSEMVIERARRLVEHHQDVMIFLDSITRLARAYNQVIPPSGRTLSGGLDPAALHMPKRFFGAARNMREGGSLTILATALIETGSKMDDVVYEEFKGTGNMEMILDRKLQERRIFPAINIPKSSTRREDLLLTEEELEAVNRMRKSFNSMKSDDAVDQVISLFTRTRNNKDFIHLIEKQVM